MNRRTLFAVVIVLFLLVVGGLVGGYFYLTNTTAPEPTGEGVGASGSLAENVATEPLETSAVTGLNADGTVPRIRHLTDTPVAGYDFVETSEGYEIWHIARADGNVFKTSTSSTETVRITNTTIPKVYEAYIGKNGSNIILRTLSDAGLIQTFIGTPRASASTSTDSLKELSGAFTADIISFLSLSPAKDRFFGITGATTGAGNFYGWNGRGTNVFSSPLKQWIPQWVNASTILMTSAPSARTQNVVYFLNPNTKAFTPVIGAKNGLVASASPDANKLLFSENRGNELQFGLYDVKTRTETAISNKTIPDKCVWSQRNPSKAYCGFPKDISLGGLYPDDWYQGQVSFNDVIRSFDAITFRFETVADMEIQVGAFVDAIDLKLSPDERYLLFTNKNDLTLWMVEL